MFNAISAHGWNKYALNTSVMKEKTLVENLTGVPANGARKEQQEKNKMTSLAQLQKRIKHILFKWEPPTRDGQASPVHHPMHRHVIIS
jgi:hypothetical protein